MPLPECRQLDSDEIPVIDISRLQLSDGATEIICEIDRACRDTGFFYIVGHGFDMHLTSQLQASAAEFFRQPESAKLDLGLDPSMRDYRGITTRVNKAGEVHQDDKVFYNARSIDTDTSLNQITVFKLVIDNMRCCFYRKSQ